MLDDGTSLRGVAAWSVRPLVLNGLSGTVPMVVVVSLAGVVVGHPVLGGGR